MNTMAEIFGEPIYTYSRAQALADGVLIELPPELVKQAGLKFPVAITAAAYAETIKLNDRARKAMNDETGRAWDVANDVEVGFRSHDDPVGRAWDVVWMLRCAAARATGETMFFTVHAVTPTGRGIKPSPVRLKAVCGPNDDMSPCITVMLPEED